MNFETTHGKTIDEAFAIFDRDNPDIYNRFVELVFKATSKGKKKLSSKMIINVIRWETYLTTKTETDFKINDAYTSRYARKFAEDYPIFSEIFNYRELRAR